jgi:hypothetical protein
MLLLQSLMGWEQERQESEQNFCGDASPKCLDADAVSPQSLPTAFFGTRRVESSGPESRETASQLVTG